MDGEGWIEGGRAARERRGRESGRCGEGGEGSEDVFCASPAGGQTTRRHHVLSIMVELNVVETTGGGVYRLH